MNRLPLITMALFGAIDGSLSASADEEPAPRPKFQLLRQNEDWSAVRDRQPTSVLDHIKYVPLDDTGDVWLSFGGHARVRAEAWDDFGFGQAPPGARTDDIFAPERVLLHGDLHIGEDLRVFAEGKHACLLIDRELAGGRRPLDVDVLDLQQGFIDYGLDLSGNSRLTLRAGRQMLQFGRQRLVSPLPWGNALRSWDGGAAILDTAPWRVTGFWTVFDPVQKYDFNDGTRDVQFGGAYAEGSVPGTEADLDLYFLSLLRDGVTFNGTFGDEDRFTLGARVAGRTAPFDGEIELAWQFGDLGGHDICAGMIALEAGYSMPDAPGRPRTYVAFDYATGDRRPGGSVQTFDPLFPLGHAYFGIMDQIGRQNILDLSGGVGATLAEGLTGEAAVHAFWLADEDDALYNAGGGVLRPGGRGSDHYVGVELDVTVKKVFRPGLVGEAGYGHFFAGAVLRNTRSADDMDFFYVSMLFTF